MVTGGVLVGLSIQFPMLRCKRVLVKLPINLINLLQQRTIESERVEYKAGWNPESVIHTLSAFANDFHDLDDSYAVVGEIDENICL